MGRAGSGRAGWTWAVLSLVALAAGLMALTFCARVLAPLGLRPALFAAELALVTPALLLAAAFGRLRELAGETPGDPKLVARALAAGAALWLLSLGLMDAQARVWPPPAGYLEAFRGLHAQLRPAGPADALLSLLVIALMPAACEEALFRGVLLPALVAVAGRGAGLVVSALLFGMIHVDPAGSSVTFYRVPFAVVVGVGFGLLRLRTRTLLAPLVAHAALNALTFGAVPLLDEPAQDVTTLPHPALGLGLVALGLWGLWGALRTRDARAAQ